MSSLLLRRGLLSRGLLLSASQHSAPAVSAAARAAPTSSVSAPLLPGAGAAGVRCFASMASDSSVWARRHTPEFAASMNKSSKLLADRGAWAFTQAWIPGEDGCALH
jgi:hypothetical protein